MLLNVEKVTPDVIEQIIAQKLFKCNLPIHLGGLNWGLIQTLDFFEEVACQNGSLGWLIQIGNGGNYFASSFPEEVTDEIYSSVETVIAGSGAPNGVAQKVENGYIISGKWPYCSGSDYANWFTMSCIVEATDHITSFIARRDQIEIINDWDTMGMRDTSSNTIQASNIFIEERFCFDVNKNYSHIENEVLNLPFVLYAELFFMSIIIGLSRKIIKEAKLLIPSRMMIDQKQIEEKTGCILQLIELMKKQVNDLLLEVNMKPTEKEAHELSNYLKNNIKEVRMAIHDMFPHLGMRAIHHNHPITQAYQDLITIAQHAMLRN